MLQTSENVQVVFQIKNAVPSVILYDDNVLVTCVVNRHHHQSFLSLSLHTNTNV